MKKRSHKGMINLKKIKRDDVVDIVAKGAAGVAVTAGVIAAGAALASRKNRQKLGKTIEEGIKTLQEQTEVVKERLPKYQAILHRVRGRKSKHVKKSSTKRKT